ncbi:MAG: GNAT family N-acetyltransferase [Actinobacteria bacterium HGW-Actinobacteria-7]|nr:MAG: GNAT family N-acetyltransferase [Actinobacteria bacterium HGW-Actinobacteria-7]
MTLPVEIEFVDALAWERAEELAALLYEILYRDFGVDRAGAWREHESGSVTAVALGPDGALLGTARLLPQSEGAPRQVRQVAVDPVVRGTGVGRALMEAVERRARAEADDEVVLHARDTAIDFYQRLGYQVVSDVFVSGLTGIEHRTMRKHLG